MNPLDTNYAQETVESPLYWLSQNQDISYMIAYHVFGDAYVGANDFIILGRTTGLSTNVNGPFPGPGTFDN